MLKLSLATERYTHFAKAIEINLRSGPTAKFSWRLLKLLAIIVATIEWRPFSGGFAASTDEVSRGIRRSWDPEGPSSSVRAANVTVLAVLHDQPSSHRKFLRPVPLVATNIDSRAIGVSRCRTFLFCETFCQSFLQRADAFACRAFHRCDDQRINYTRTENRRT